jgi:hypothetical protein
MKETNRYRLSAEETRYDFQLTSKSVKQDYADKNLSTGLDSEQVQGLCCTENPVSNFALHQH